jgi:hypothetical protein
MIFLPRYANHSNPLNLFLSVSVGDSANAYANHSNPLNPINHSSDKIIMATIKHYERLFHISCAKTRLFEVADLRKALKGALITQ